jgi:hypothetical protein
VVKKDSVVEEIRDCGYIRRYSLSFVVLTVLMAIGLGNKANAGPIPVIVVTCAGCTTQEGLFQEAGKYVTTWEGKTPPGYVGFFEVLSMCSSPTPAGTIMLVVSSSLPISGAYYPCQRDAKITSYSAFAITATTDAETISADAAVLSRSAKTTEITLPSGLTLTGSEPEEISAWLSSASGIPLDGATTLGFWHALTNFPQLIQGTFINTATGQTFTVWNGDVITVVDPDGNTAQFQYTPLSSIQWTLVPGSIRNSQGAPIGSTTTPTGALTGAAVTVGYPGGPTVTITPYNDTTPTGTVTVGDPINVPIGLPSQVCVLDPCSL